VVRSLEKFGFCLSAVALWACGQSSLSAPKLPARGDIETRVIQPKIQREIPRLIAPPPAYGNKIVMAQSAPRGITN
jgi:hypothetical protein